MLSKDDRKKFRFNEKTSKRLERFGISKDTFNKHVSYSGKTYSDIFMFLSGEISRKLAKENDFQNLSQIYYEMASFLFESGKDGSRFLAESNKMELLSISSMELFSKAEIITSSCCNNCSELNGKSYDIDYLLENNILPNNDCSRIYGKEKFPHCVCSYVADTKSRTK